HTSITSKNRWQISYLSAEELVREHIMTTFQFSLRLFYEGHNLSFWQHYSDEMRTRDINLRIWMYRSNPSLRQDPRSLFIQRGIAPQTSQRFPHIAKRKHPRGCCNGAGDFIHLL